ncbi:SAP30-binding protein Transcriptional regulator protein HCNGP [Channa argus]|uniref:SAP30-binding protein Transcriptional regulator protein HCNGP n=1 Tax=Channa argus TaxID=215402 RepID=A0A6G1QQX8_CHAAH|nr:SAP30-binding protein Transcriptional regulator protein HCNGP [Channa argus]
MYVKEEVMDILQRVWTKLQNLPQASPLEVGAFSILILFVAMASGKKSALLSSLADYGDDSEPDSDTEPEETEGRVGGLVYGYGDDDFSRIEDPDDKVSGDEDSRESNSGMEESDEERDADDVEISETERKDPNELVAQSLALVSEQWLTCTGVCLCVIYEKLIQYCGIDELGTNYPKDMFDPHGWSEDSYYEALAKAQKVEMDKLEKAKKERTKIEFVTGTKKGTNPSSTAASTTSSTTSTATEAQKRKSKWDSAIPVTLAQPTLITTTATLPAVVSVTTTASGTKTTVISAVGTILKKAKQ